MAKPAQTPRINVNILYPQGIPQKLPVKFLKWLLTFGRYIAVFVEILVLATFAARFKFDADLADINEKINQQIPFIESLSEEEATIRQTQFKIDAINKTFANYPKYTDLLSRIAQNTPGGVILSTINFDQTDPATALNIRVAGQSSSNSDLSVFLNALTLDTTFKDVNLTNSTFEQGVISFIITAGVN